MDIRNCLVLLSTRETRGTAHRTPWARLNRHPAACCVTELHTGRFSSDHISPASLSVAQMIRERQRIAWRSSPASSSNSAKRNRYFQLLHGQIRERESSPKLSLITHVNTTPAHVDDSWHSRRWWLILCWSAAMQSESDLHRWDIRFNACGRTHFATRVCFALRQSSTRACVHKPYCRSIELLFNTVTSVFFDKSRLCARSLATSLIFCFFSLSATFSSSPALSEV